MWKLKQGGEGRRAGFVVTAGQSFFEQELGPSVMGMCAFCTSPGLIPLQQV